MAARGADAAGSNVALIMKNLGLAISTSLLLRANQIIE
jgi:hypothetical protein